MNRRRLINGSVLLLFTTVALVWLLREPRFRGKPESEWIAGIEYFGGEEQTRRWHGFGRDGLKMLGRALDRQPLDGKDTAAEWAYAWFIHQVPDAVAMRLPKPSANNQDTPMRILSLLTRLGTNAYPVEASIARLMNDGRPGVAQLAIGCYGEEGLFSVMKAGEMAARLPDFLRCLASGNPGLRNNAAVAAAELPEHAAVLVPALTNILSEPELRTRALICKTLAHLDREAAIRAGVVSLAIAILKNSDNQIAHQGAEILGELAAEPELSVPALIVGAQGSEPLVAVCSIRALDGFTNEAALITPVLTNALKSTNSSVRRQAGETLRKLSAGK